MGKTDRMYEHFKQVNKGRMQPATNNRNWNARALPGPADQLTKGYPGYGDWSPAEGLTDQHSNLTDYWNKIKKRKLAILGCIGAGALAGLIFSMAQTPLYRTVTSVEVDDLNENFQNLKDQDPTASSSAAESYFQTQIKVLQSRDMVERVIAKLHLEDRVAQKPHFWSGWLHRDVEPEQAAALRHEQVVTEVQKHLTVQAFGQTRIAEIYFEDRDPKIAAQFANTLVSEFVTDSRETRWDATQATAEWLTGHLNTLKKNLEASENQLQDYARSSGLVITAETGNVADQKLQQVQEELSKAQATLIDKQANYEIARDNPVESLPATLDDPTMRDYRQKLTELERQHAELSSTLTPEHFKVRKVEAEIAELQTALEKERGNIVKRAGDEYQAAQRRTKLLSRSYAEQARTVSDVNGKTIRYSSLKHEVDTNRQLYDALLLRIKQAGLAAAMRSSNVLVVDAAKPPVFPYKPNFRVNAAFGLLSGLFLGVAFVLVSERTARSIESPGMSQWYLKLPELGVIPMAEDSRRRLDWFPAASANNMQLVPVSKNGNGNGSGNGFGNGLKPAASPMSEAYRGALSSILLPTLHGASRQIIVVTSAEAGAGKTTVTSNLGVATAETGRSVLLIDADFRRPRLHHIFDMPNTTGLTDLLRLSTPIETTPLRSLVQPTKIPGLCLMTSGPNTNSPSSLLYSPRLVEFLERMGREFDLVLIDAPPMLQFADARVMGRYSDGVILVLRAGQTKWEAAMLACQRFEEDQTRVLGTILNNWDLKHHEHTPYGDAYSDAYTDTHEAPLDR
jgi:polysaccharide biosynthesis transport protein